MGLTMDITCGLVISALFLQLWLLSIPLKLIMGNAGSASNPAEIENLLVNTSEPRTEKDWKDLFDMRIGVAHANGNCEVAPGQLLGEGYAQMLTIPRFAPFTEILTKLANDSSIRLLAISGNDDNVAAKVVLAPSTGARIQEIIVRLDTLDGCEVLKSYQYGWATQEDYANGNMQWHVILRVQIPKLLAFVKDVTDEKDIDLASFPASQVYCMF